MKEKENLRIQRIITIVGILLFLVKILAFYLTNSVAILTDALESTINVASALFGLYALHLACNVLRAVEMRKPTLVAANTGLSAVIDATGNILREGPRRQTGLIVFTAERQRGWSAYRLVGDWFWMFAGWATWGAAIWSWADRTNPKQSGEKLSSGGRT